MNALVLTEAPFLVLESGDIVVGESSSLTWFGPNFAEANYLTPGLSDGEDLCRGWWAIISLCV